MDTKLAELREKYSEGAGATWEYYLLELKNQDDMDSSLNKECFKSMQFLSTVFDDAWMRSVFPEHALFGFLSNRAPLGRAEVISLANKIRHLKLFENHDHILNRFKSTDGKTCAAAISEMDALYYLQSLNLKPVKVSDKKTSDFTARINNADVAVEVRRLGTPHQLEENMKTFNAIQDVVLPIARDVAFRIHKSLAPRALSKLKEKLEQGVKDRKKGTPFILREQGVIDFCAVKGEPEFLRRWCKESNVDSSMSSSGVNSDPVKRMKSKINDKLVRKKQLPTDAPSMLIIDAEYEFIFIEQHLEKSFNHIVNSLDQEVYKYPQLLGVVIMGRIGYLYGAEEEKTLITEMCSPKSQAKLIKHDGRAFIWIPNIHSDFIFWDSIHEHI